MLDALWAWLCSPLATRVHVERNRSGRLHVYWSRGGNTYEFHAPGRSRMTYVRNLLYWGQVRQR